MRLGDDPEAIKLAACLAASLVAHAGIGAWMPGPHRHPVETLPVVLSVALPPAPLPVAPAMPAAEPEAQAPRAPAPKPPARTAPPRAPPLAPPAPAPAPREPASRSAPPVAAESTSADPAPARAAPAPAEGVRNDAAAVGPRASAPVAPPSYGAAYLRNPVPRYPSEARREGAEGTVLLRVWVAADGAATRVEIDRSSGHRALDAAALGAVRNWRFVPAQRGGEAVEGVVTVPLVFRLETGG